MAEIAYVRYANWNLVQTVIKDLREDRLEQLEKENKKLKEENEKLKKWMPYSKFLIKEEKEIEKLGKENKKLREKLEKLKSTYVYDAKQVRDIC